MSLTIEQRLSALEAIMGDTTTPAEADLARPHPAELPNGDYPLFYRMHQIGAAINDDVSKVNSFDGRLKALESGTPAVTQPPVVSPVLDVAADTGTPHSVMDELPSREGAGLRFILDTDNTSKQRPQGTTYKQVFEVSGSEDGGGGLHQNVVWPGGGLESWIPDPTRNGISIRMDRSGALSFNVYTPGVEFEPGKFRLVVAHKGQLSVFYPQANGDLIVRLPQYNGRLLVEKGWGGEPSHPNGHMEVRETCEVQLGPDIGYQRGL